MSIAEQAGRFATLSQFVLEPLPHGLTVGLHAATFRVGRIGVIIQARL